jgi:hypothetical protein
MFSIECSDGSAKKAQEPQCALRIVSESLDRMACAFLSLQLQGETFIPGKHGAMLSVPLGSEFVLNPRLFQVPITDVRRDQSTR